MENFKYIIVLFVAVLFGCKKKYPEDDKRSLKKPEKRLMENIWVVTDYLVDGQDSSSKVYFSSIVVGGNNGNSFVFKDLQFRFKEIKDKGYDDKIIVLKSFEIKKQSELLGTGSWGLINNDDNVFIKGGYGLYLFDPSAESWKIIELTKKKLSIKCLFNNKEYQLKFKKGEF